MKNDGLFNMRFSLIKHAAVHGPEADHIMPLLHQYDALATAQRLNQVCDLLLKLKGYLIIIEMNAVYQNIILLTLSCVLGSI